MLFFEGTFFLSSYMVLEAKPRYIPCVEQLFPHFFGYKTEVCDIEIKKRYRD